MAMAMAERRVVLLRAAPRTSQSACMRMVGSGRRRRFRPRGGVCGVSSLSRGERPASANAFPAAGPNPTAVRVTNYSPLQHCNKGRIQKKKLWCSIMQCFNPINLEAFSLLFTVKKSKGIL